MPKTMQSETIGQLGAALAIAQKQMNSALKDSQNPVFPSAYANLAAVWSAARKPLADNELSVIQTTDFTKKNHYLVTTLIHSSGEWIRGRLKFGFDTSHRLLNENQALGSSITYMRRYALAAIVGVIQEDDDANGSAGTKKEIAEREERQKVIRRIKDGECCLDEPQHVAAMDRRKVLGVEDLYDPAIPLLKLTELGYYLGDKYRAKVAAEASEQVDTNDEPSVLDGEKEAEEVEKLLETTLETGFPAELVQNRNGY